MIEIPRFRRMIKAIGDHIKPKETAYHYEIVDFQANGQFVRPTVFIKDTEMRADDVKLYEMQEAGVWVLISEQEFKAYKLAWDALRLQLGYVRVDEMGQELELSAS